MTNKETRLNVRLRNEGEVELVARVQKKLRAKDSADAVRRALLLIDEQSPAQLRTLVEEEGSATETEVPLLGTVSAGAGMMVLPFEAGQTVRVGRRVPPTWYALKVAGDSMDGGELPIFDGDILLFSPASEAPNGWTVHAEWLELGAAEPCCTVKKLRRDPDGVVALLPANPDGYSPIVFDPDEQRVEEFGIRGIYREKA